MTASKPRTTRPSATAQQDPLYERLWNWRIGLMPFYVAFAVLCAGVWCSLPWERLIAGTALFGLVEWGEVTRYGPLAVVGLSIQLLALSRTRSTPALVMLGIVLLSGGAWAAALPIVVARSFAVDSGAGMLSLLFMPGILLIFTLFFGVFWWASKVNRNRATVESEDRSWADIAAQFGLGETKRQNHVDMGGSVTGQLVWPRGRYTVEDVMRRKTQIEGAMGLDRGTLRLMHHGKATDRLDYAAFRDDPQTEAVEWPGVPLDPATGEAVGEMTCKEPTPIGRTDEGEEIKLFTWKAGFGTSNKLFGGDQGSGKSGGLNLHIGHLACCDDAVQAFMDFKGGVELGPWHGTGLFTLTDTDKIMEMLPAIQALLKCRQELLADKDFMAGRLWVPRGMPRKEGDPVQAPYFGMWIDEIAELMGSRDGRSSTDQRKVIDTMKSFVRNDRALGIGVNGATQQFQLDALAESGFRNRFNQRICYRVGQPEEEAKILGMQTTVGAINIDADRPGTAYIVDQQKLLTKPVRYYYFTDELVDQLSKIREFGGCELEPYTDDAMADASPWYAEQRRLRRERMRAAGVIGDDADVIIPVRPDEQIRPWIAITGPAIGGLDRAESRESDTRRDVPLSAMFAAHDERKATEGGEQREGAPAPRREAPSLPAGPTAAKLPEAEAWAAAMEALRAAGPDGLGAADIYRAATRKSSWFHEQWKVRYVETEGGDGTVVRTRQGRYALVMAHSA